MPLRRVVPGFGVGPAEEAVGQLKAMLEKLGSIFRPLFLSRAIGDRVRPRATLAGQFASRTSSSESGPSLHDDPGHHVRVKRAVVGVGPRSGESVRKLLPIGARLERDPGLARPQPPSPWAIVDSTLS